MDAVKLAWRSKTAKIGKVSQPGTARIWASKAPSGSQHRVVTIAPGYIKTAMTAHNPYSMPFLMDAGDFARRAHVAIERGASYRVIPWQMGVVARLMRLLPNAVYDRLARNAPRKPRKAG